MLYGVAMVGIGMLSHTGNNVAMDSFGPIADNANGIGEMTGVGEKAWQLIDAAGCRGLRHGGAMVSDKHCNFLINTGEATAADIEALGEEVRARVREASGIELHWEIRRIGLPGGATGGPAA